MSNDLLAFILVHGQAAFSNVADFAKSLKISENSFAPFAPRNDVIKVEHNSKMGGRRATARTARETVSAIYEEAQLPRRIALRCFLGCLKNSRLN